MFVLSDTAMNLLRRMLIVAAAAGVPLFGCASGQERARESPPVTVAEYESILQRVLPCPEPGVREARDYQLCLLIVPPGHRIGERELLAAISSTGGSVEMLLVQPEVPLWQLADEAKAGGATDWNRLRGLKIRTFRTRDSKVVTRVAGGSWRELRTEVVPQHDWFMDPTEYRIKGHTLAGDVALDLRGPGASAERQPLELFVWAERLRKQAGAILDKVHAEVAELRP
jgi:hypothetical protein